MQKSKQALRSQGHFASTGAFSKYSFNTKQNNRELIIIRCVLLDSIFSFFVFGYGNIMLIRLKQRWNKFKPMIKLNLNTNSEENFSFLVIKLK